MQACTRNRSIACQYSLAASRDSGVDFVGGSPKGVLVP
jgi:hypothetical protein